MLTRNNGHYMHVEPGRGGICKMMVLEKERATKNEKKWRTRALQ